MVLPDSRADRSTLLSRSVARADLNYRTEITGVEDNELALRRRADRDLGRLADAAVGRARWLLRR
jgi:hypothetical protein